MLTTKKGANSPAADGVSASLGGKSAFSAASARVRYSVLAGGIVAVVLLGSLTGCSPTGAKALLKGEQLIKQGHAEKALPLLKRAVEDLPEQAQAWNHLGIAQHMLGDRESAIRSYQQALQKNRNLAVVHQNLGKLHEETGNAAAALEEFTRFTILQPDSIEGWLDLGLAQVRARQWEAGERSLQYYLRFHPRSSEALNSLGLIQTQRKKYREAYTLFQSASQSHPPYTPAVLNMATVALAHLNNRPFALQKFRDYLAIDVDSPQSSAVRTLVAHLDAELNPPARVVTNQPNPVLLAKAASSNVPPALSSSNAVLRVQQGLTNAAQRNSLPEPKPGIPQVVKQPALVSNAPPDAGTSILPQTNKPAPAVLVKPKVSVAAEAAPPPKTADPLPVKVVENTEDVPKTVVEPPVPPVPSPSQATSVEAILQKEKELADAADTKANPSESAAVKAGNKPGLLSKLNPQSWFKKSEKPPTPLARNPAPRQTPLAPRPVEESSKQESRPVVQQQPEPSSSAVPMSFASYAYLSPSAPAVGDHVKAEAYFAEGAKNQDQGRLAASMASYRAAIQADAAYFEAHYNLAVAAGQAGETLASLRAYEHALSVQPKSLAARFNFALALQRANYPVDAAREFERLIQDHPGQGRAHFALANLYSQILGRNDLARKSYQKVLEVDPGHPQAVAIRQWLATHP